MLGARQADESNAPNNPRLTQGRTDRECLRIGQCASRVCLAKNLHRSCRETVEAGRDSGLHRDEVQLSQHIKGWLCCLIGALDSHPAYALRSCFRSFFNYYDQIANLENETVYINMNVLDRLEHSVEYDLQHRFGVALQKVPGWMIGARASHACRISRDI